MSIGFGYGILDCHSIDEIPHTLFRMMHLALAYVLMVRT
jgi:hypothetical protein